MSALALSHDVIDLPAPVGLRLLDSAARSYWSIAIFR